MENIYNNKKALGSWGERLAAEHLKAMGYKIVYRNYRCRFGEIDLICRDGAVWCFVEVKTRKSTQYGDGLQAITPLKQKHLYSVALYFLNQIHDTDAAARFDVVSIRYQSEFDYDICLVQNAFSI
ncbi:MAG TPA: YraN family protein [Bacillota bacterium]|nr:YraN family protein [Bacillota bacterium]